MPLSFLKKLLGVGRLENASEPTAPPRSEPEAEPKPDEKRQWPRIKLDLTVRIRFPSSEAALASRTFDISRGGCFVKMARPRPVGTAVRLILEIGDQTLTIGGKIVRIVGASTGAVPGMGVEFTEISTETRAYLDAMLEMSAPRRH